VISFSFVTTENERTQKMLSHQIKKVRFSFCCVTSLNISTKETQKFLLIFMFYKN